MNNIWHEGSESPVKTDTIICKTSDGFLTTCFFYEGQQWNNIINSGFHSINEELVTITSWCYLHELFNLQEKLRIAVEVLEQIDNPIAKKALEEIKGE